MKKRLLCAAVFIAALLLLYVHLYHREKYNSAINYVAGGTDFIKKQVGFQSYITGPRVTLPDIPTDTSKDKALSNILDTVVGSDNSETEVARGGDGHTDQHQYTLRHDKECKRLRLIPTSTYGESLQAGQGVSFFTKYNNDFKFLYCSIPKVASTNWKRMMIVLALPEEDRAHLTRDEVNNMKNVHNDPRVPALSHLGWEIKPENRAYTDYYKFVLFRHPFTRMVSAWRNKFQSERVNRYFYTNFGVPIMKITRGEKAITDFYANNKDNLLTFREFVIGIKNGIIDRHWMPQSELCLPCEIKYSYVGFFEHLTDDTNHIWDEIGVQEEMIRADHISEKGQLKSTTLYTQELFSNLTHQDVEDLYLFYKKDFVLFGYDKDVNSPTFPYPAIPTVT